MGHVWLKIKTVSIYQLTYRQKVELQRRASVQSFSQWWSSVSCHPLTQPASYRTDRKSEGLEV